jgi:hypothetical protein
VGGLGLGLAISKAIIERHDGKIYASSKGSGTGATFTIRGATEDDSSEVGFRPLASSYLEPASVYETIDRRRVAFAVAGFSRGTVLTRPKISEARTRSDFIKQ